MGRGQGSRGRFPFVMASGRQTAAESLERRLCFSAYAVQTVADLVPYPAGNGLDSNLVADAGGDLFGTTYSGGVHGEGTVYELVAGSGAIKSLFSFGGADGSNPSGRLVVGRGGLVYGVAASGGSNGYGVVFALAPSTGAVTTVASLPAYAKPDGDGLVVDGSGDVYWIGDGGIYGLLAGTSTVTTAVSFTTPVSASDNNPSLAADPAGDLFYALNPYGSASTIGELPSHASVPQTLFTGPADGSTYRSLLTDAGGNLFGLAIPGSGGVRRVRGARGDADVPDHHHARPDDRRLRRRQPGHRRGRRPVRPRVVRGDLAPDPRLRGAGRRVGDLGASRP